MAHFLRDKMPWIWNLVNIFNSFLFSLRYSGKLKKINIQEDVKNYKVLPIREVDTAEFEQFFANQPEEAFRFVGTIDDVIKKAEGLKG